MINRNATTARVSDTDIGDVTDQWTYNSFGEVTGYELKYLTTTLYSYTLTRDDLGRVTAKTEYDGASNSYDYVYDSAGRLIEVEKNSAAYSDYEYDDNSNRDAGTHAGTAFTAVYDAQDRLTDYNLFDFTYNNAGELTGKTNTLTSETWAYVYDVFGNLRSVTLPNTDVISYEADGFNRRMTRKVNGTVTARYMYDSMGRLMAELDDAGNLVSRFVYGTRGHVPDYMIKSGVEYRLALDPLGSVRRVIKVSDGTVAQNIAYTDLGMVVTDSSPGFQPFGYAGGIYDSATGLVRFGARDYDASVGRWTMKDPILFAGGDTNLYGYVLSDPINFIDPTGLTQEQIDNALNWLRQNHPSITNGMENWSIRNGWLPFQGGITLPGNNIRINTCGMDDADVVDIVSHELMHARDGFWRTIFGGGRNHDSIYDAAARIANQYRNK